LAEAKKYRWQALVIGVCFLFIGVYAFFDPENIFFPKCPFLWATGLECPGCGSQRALHSLLHGDVAAAFGYNQLMVLMLPYIGAAGYMEYFGGKRRFPKTRQVLMGREACYALLGLFVLFFLLRNFVI